MSEKHRNDTMLVWTLPRLTMSMLDVEKLGYYDEKSTVGTRHSWTKLVKKHSNTVEMLFHKHAWREGLHDRDVQIMETIIPNFQTDLKTSVDPVTQQLRGQSTMRCNKDAMAWGIQDNHKSVG